MPKTISPASGVASSSGTPKKIAQEFKQALENICFVDSGIGGAMAAKLTPGHIDQFGSSVCLPIGDKDRPQIITYTAQMILEGMVGQNRDHIIIACNTASTARPEALKVVRDFILDQAMNSERSIYRPEDPRFQRIQELSEKILYDDGDYLAKHVHGIVLPTVADAANTIRGILASQDKVTVRIDSTNGTVNSETYIMALCRNLQDSMLNTKHGALKHFSVLNTKNAIIKFDGLAGRFPPQSVNNLRIIFTNKETGKIKEALIQNRGDSSWVNAVEGNKTSIYEALAVEAQDLARKLSLESKTDQQFHIEFYKNFSNTPDLTMLCCTHFPAFRTTLTKMYEEQGARSPQFLQQDEVALRIAANILAGKFDKAFVEKMLQQPEEGASILRVTLGDHRLSGDSLRQTKAVLDIIYQGLKEVHVTPLDQSRGIDYANIHKQMEFDTAQRPGSAYKHADKTTGIHTKWKQDKTNPDPQKRADAHIVAGTPTSSTAQVSITKALDLFPLVTSVDPTGKPSRTRATTGVRKLFSTIAQLGRLGTLGEDRGISILGIKYDPGQSLIEAAGMMAQIVKENRQGPQAVQRSVGIVTGFTVVDAHGAKISGENDGPPGAVILAKSLLRQHVGVVLIADTGAESSLVSALIGAKLVTGNKNTGSAPGHTLNKLTLVPGLYYDVIEHGPDFPGPQTSQHQIEVMKARLIHQNIGLLISIERPSPNVSGGMSSMSGASIKPFNADMSPLFRDHPYKTIGIGDGGNEIGTAGAQEMIKSAKKPDFTPVVNKGDQIAATARTDVMILNSVSNNGGIFLATAFDLMLGGLFLNNLTENHPLYAGSTSLQSVEERIVDYYGIIFSMFKAGMSLDGVNKVNALTVDGRQLSRSFTVGGQLITPAQRPSQPGEITATHEDMFDAMIKTIKDNHILVSHKQKKQDIASHTPKGSRSKL